MLIHKRAINDTNAKLRTQLKADGIPVDLNDGAGTLTVKFEMWNEAGVAVIPETDVGVTIVDPDIGEVEFDFPAGAAVATPGSFYGYWNVYNSDESESDTYPDDEDGILIILFDPGANRTPAAETIDVIAAANAPKRTRTVEGTVEERSIRELIEADRYSKMQDVEAVPWGMRIAKMKPPGMLS